MASFSSRSELANGFTMTESGEGRYSTVPIRLSETAANQTSGLSHTETNAAEDSNYSGDGGAWQATEQSQLMGVGVNQANGLSNSVVGSAVQTTMSSQSNQPSEPISGSNIHRAQSDCHASGDSSPVTCSPVQEQGDGYAGAQAPILLPYFQPGEANLVSSMGNTKKPTENCCST
ncbi:uncharacterized protein [Montipora foliosa]|uniref:uncharacterized protein isoform X1 n=1 Tax=Montipora foliosa TaxID=591990 RepID=UPI0035F1325A